MIIQRRANHYFPHEHLAACRTYEIVARWRESEDKFTLIRGE